MVYQLGWTTLPGLRGLEAPARALWEKRFLIREHLGRGADAEVDHDLLDLALSWTELSVRRAAPGEEAAARRQALRVLAEAETGPEAETLCGTFAALVRRELG